MPSSRPIRMFVVSMRDDGNHVTGVLDLDKGAVRGGPRQVFPPEGEAFLLACWFSLRGTYVWGELEAPGGVRISRDDALELVDAHASRGETPAGLISEDLAAGDAPEQRLAEGMIISALGLEIGAPLLKSRKTHGGSTIEFDGFCAEPPILAEAWAHQGSPKPAQKNKVMADALKMVWGAAALFPGRRVRKILALSDSRAAAHFRGRSWMATALRDLDVEVIVVELPIDVVRAIRDAQERQFR